MSPFKAACLCLTFLFIYSSSIAKGPKGGPSFADYEWTEIVETDFLTPDRWEPRAGLQAVELHNHLFVIGGRTPLPPTQQNPFASLIHGDVWVSSDLGETWFELIDDAQSAGLWKNRAYFEAVTKDGYIYIMGGQNFTTFVPGPPFVLPSEFFKDVWRSKNGVDWEPMTSDAEWATFPEKCQPPFGPPVSQGRAGLSAVSFKGKLWVLGGSQGDDTSLIPGGGGEDCRDFFNDVWYSQDGSEWHLATDDAPWEARAGGIAVVKGGWLYYMGGEKGFVAETDYFNDVWRTQDGMNWEKVMTSPEGQRWSPRPGHKCSVVANHFVCMGGFGTPFNPSDIWVSKDGADWTKVSDTPWNNNPISNVFACPPPLPPLAPDLICDNVRYDFDMLTVSGGKGGMKPSIFTFGGDREVFFPIPDYLPPNFMRVENDVWRYSPQE